MQFSAKSAKISTLSTACLLVPVFSKGEQLEVVQTLDAEHEQIISRLLEQGDIKGKVAETLMVHLSGDSEIKRLLLVGMGEAGKTSPVDFIKSSTASAKALKSSIATSASSTLLTVEVKDKDLEWKVRQTVLTTRESFYQYSQTLSKSAPEAHALTNYQFLALTAADEKLIDQASAVANSIANGVQRAKTLADLPGNVCTPSYLASTAQEMANNHSSLQVTILEEAEMEELGMGSFLSVSRGSRQAAKLITIEHKGGAASQKPIVLIGKGLTFDAGGISIKPSSGMDEMKYDMCGGASVFGVLQMCAELNLAINVVGLIPASENLPDGDANKPGDVVTSMSGQTIEILNTDAEGRLILCDALTYSEKFKPEVVIDIATLTGACVVALGKHATGLLGNNEALADEILAAGIQAQDKAWQLPLWDEYQDQLKSNFADIANIGGPAGGTITAACFLSRFTEKYQWAHLDIAGTAWKSGADKGATGRPVHLLSQFILNRC